MLRLAEQLVIIKLRETGTDGEKEVEVTTESDFTTYTVDVCHPPPLKSLMYTSSLHPSAFTAM